MKSPDLADISASLLDTLRRLRVVSNGLMARREEIASRMAEAVVDVAGDPVALLHAQGALGINAFYLGDVVTARGHFERGIALYERCKARSQTLPSLFDYGVLCRIGAAVALQQLGYADQARQRGAEALALAERLDETARLELARGGAVERDGGRLRLTSRDGLRTLLERGGLEPPEYEAGLMYRRCFETGGASPSCFRLSG